MKRTAYFREWRAKHPTYRIAVGTRARANKKDHLERSGPQDGLSLLIVVWMTVTPTPVLALSSGVLPVVHTIGPVLNHIIAPVGAIFAIIPVIWYKGLLATVAVIPVDKLV
jgi:hypothetical protein